MQQVNAAPPLSDVATASIGAVLDAHPISWIQWRIFILCAMAALLEGFDSQLIAFTVPLIARDLHVPAAGFGPVFVATQVGFLFGAFLLAPVADRVGRKPVLTVFVAAAGLMTIAVPFAGSLFVLLGCRFLLGVCIGAMLPAFISLATEYAPPRVRSLIISAVLTCVPLGGVLAGFAASMTLEHYGWRPLYWAGGFATVTLAAAIFFLTIESLGFLVARDADPARIGQLMRRLWPRSTALPGRLTVDEVQQPRGTVAALFTNGNAVSTLLLWGAFFFTYAALFGAISWSPTLFHKQGLGLGVAARIVTINNIGSMIGGLVIGRLLDRIGPRRLVGCALLLGALCYVLIGRFTIQVAPLTILSFAAGMMVGGSAAGLAVITSRFYPAGVRSTGVGWAMGVGRLGGIFGPLVMGLMVGAGAMGGGIFAAVGAMVVAAALFSFVAPRSSENARRA